MEAKKELYLTDYKQWRRQADTESQRRRRENACERERRQRQKNIDDQLRDVQAHELNVLTSNYIGKRLRMKANEKGVSTRQLAIELGLRHSNMTSKLGRKMYFLNVPEYFYLCERLEIDPVKCYRNMKEAAKRKMEASHD